MIKQTIMSRTNVSKPKMPEEKRSRKRVPKKVIYITSSAGITKEAATRNIKNTSGVMPNSLMFEKKTSSRSSDNAAMNIKINLFIYFT
jgi:hypothetical protein